MKAIILTSFEIVKETEKAALVTTPMIVGRNVKQKEVWMPKSAFKLVEQGLAVATWLANKTENPIYHTYFNSVARNENHSILTIEA